MNSIVFAEVSEGIFKKSTLEAICYGANLAQSNGGKVIAVSLGEASNKHEAGKYGADALIELPGMEHYEDGVYASALATVCQEENAEIVIVSSTYCGRAVAPRLAVKLDAAIISGVVTNAEWNGKVAAKKSVFSGKGFATVKSEKDKTVICLTPNSIDLEEHNKEVAINVKNVALDAPAVEVLETQKAAGKIPLTEAELVVSAGRGMKGPENWGMIEELAEVLGAATACSKPVSDMDWRPHTEHVGQTGITIKPNLYIAIGISGAIQHLAGVSSSKVIVVINKDPEAPFFKAADYGIVGDAFEVVPKLIEAAKSATA